MTPRPTSPADPAATPGRFGGGLAFNAAESDHVSWPAALTAPGFAIELWSQPAGAGTVVVSDDGRLEIRVTAAGATAKYSVTVKDAGGTAFTATSADVAAGAWHHVVASLDEPTLRLWVDGARVEKTGVATGGLTLDALTLGSYTGNLDEVWVSATAVTTEADARGRYCPL